MPVGFHGLPLGAAAVPAGLGGASFPALGCVQHIGLPAHCFSVEEVQVAVGLHDPRYYREYLTLRGYRIMCRWLCSSGIQLTVV